MVTCILPNGRFRVHTRSTEQALGNLSSLSSLSTHCGILNSEDRRGLPLTVLTTAPLHPSNHLSFSRVPLLVTAATNPFYPQIPTLSPHLPPGLFPTPGAALAPSPSPAHRASVTSSPHLWPLTQHLHCIRRSPEDLACSMHSAGHLSPAHTQVSVLKSW